MNDFDQIKRNILANNNTILQFIHQLGQLGEETGQPFNAAAASSSLPHALTADVSPHSPDLDWQKEALLTQARYLQHANEALISLHNEIKKRREEVHHKDQELVTAHKTKNSLIEIVAHDLKSPLDHIKGFVSLIKLDRQKLDESTYQFIRMIEHCTTSLSEMVSNILDTEIMESQSIKFQLERADLSEILETISDRFKVEAKQKSITIHTQISREMFALVDRHYVKRIFQNLLSNAIKFSPKNRNVFVQLDHGGTKIICKVKDEGPGLSVEDKAKLFDRYQRLSARPTGGEYSTGLGLSITKKFVETMNGEIWCESQLNQGACFVVTFEKAMATA